MKPTLTIIGAGLGGCCLASRLYQYFDITLIELSSGSMPLSGRILDVGYGGHTFPLAESGLGGTTRVWHNALMEIDEQSFNLHWPYDKAELIPYYELAYMLLAGISRKKIHEYAKSLKSKLEKMHVPPSLLSHNMFIPKKRINAWSHLSLSGCVRLIEGEALDLNSNGLDSIDSISVKIDSGNIINIKSQFFVLSAGGLGTPILLQKLNQSLDKFSLSNAGFNYQDHPMAFVGEVELKSPLYKLWNWPLKEKKINASLRIPLSFFYKGLNFSFQLRPAHHFRLSKPRLKLNGIINELRNSPFNLKNYIYLFKNLNELLEILSFKFGLRMPTKRYSMLMIAEQPSCKKNSLERGGEDGVICRNWRIDPEFLECANGAVDKFLEDINPLIVGYNKYYDWEREIFSSAHHSGMARLSKDENSGVCDKNGKVHGVKNLFVCDASAIPNSGYVNTGLTIAALSLKMADYLNSFSNCR